MINPLPLASQARLTLQAEKLIRLGARIQVLEDMTPMARERLLRLYKEVKGEPPPKGMLPYSADWFMEWQPSMHAAIYLGCRSFLMRATQKSWRELLAPAFCLYEEESQVCGLGGVLSLTRAWSLERFVQAKILKEASCRKCYGVFPIHAHDPEGTFVCGLCKMPSRAGKPLKKKLLEAPR